MTNKSLQEAKELNQKSKQGATNMSTTTDYGAEEAKELNTQMTSQSFLGMTSSISSGLEETKQLNQKSRQNKK